MKLKATQTSVTSTTRCDPSGLRTYCQGRAQYYRERLEGMPPIRDRFSPRGVVGAPHPWDTKSELERARADAQARVDVYEKIASFDIISTVRSEIDSR